MQFVCLGVNLEVYMLLNFGLRRQAAYVFVDLGHMIRSPNSTALQCPSHSTVQHSPNSDFSSSTGLALVNNAEPVYTELVRIADCRPPDLERLAMLLEEKPISCPYGHNMKAVITIKDTAESCIRCDVDLAALHVHCKPATSPYAPCAPTITRAIACRPTLAPRALARPQHRHAYFTAVRALKRRASVAPAAPVSAPRMRRLRIRQAPSRARQECMRGSMAFPLSTRWATAWEARPP